VVDDEQSIRAFVEQTLRGAGYDVVLAADGPAALEIVAEQRPFDLFVIDVMMPKMRGDELARQIRHSEPDARILYFTALSDHLFEARTVLSEREAFLEKPVSIKGLLEAVSMSLFGHTQGLQR
jgi:two-component system cell cycle sensor histidine kinase/response regulator CckA